MQTKYTPKFNRARQGSGFYNCLDCGKKTRDTGEGGAGVQLCKSCYLSAELENSISDGDIDPETGKTYTNEPLAELAGLCPNCHGDINVTEDPDTVFYCGSCGCV